MRAAPPPPALLAGRELRLLVLAIAPDELIGIDLASGAFARAQPPEPVATALAPFDVADATLAGTEPVTPHVPEAVELASAPRRVGRLAGRRAERWLRPLLHPRRDHLLGLAGPSVPFWSVAENRPSVALVEPSSGPAAVLADGGFHCRFRWRNAQEELALTDSRASAVLAATGAGRFGRDDLERLLGFRPVRLVVALSPPRQGQCHKVVAALLPRP